MHHATLIAALAVLSACAGVGDGGGDVGAQVCGAFDPVDYPTTIGRCALGTESPTRLVITTTDFGSGGISVADLAGRTVEADVALSDIDSVPYQHDGLLYVVHRFGLDSIDVRDPAADFDLVGQYPITAEGVPSTNPQGVAFGPGGAGFVSTLGHPDVQVIDFSAPPGSALLERIDLSGFADGDGNPEAGLIFGCGDVVFVGLQRLQEFEPVDCDVLIAIDATTRRPYASPVPLLGSWARQVRADPSTDGVVLILTTGIERVSLATGEVTWAVDEALFADEGMDIFSLLAFDVTGDGDALYVAASRADYSAVDVWRVALSGTQTLVKVIDDVNAIDKTLEIVGDELWFGDTTPGQGGMRVYDLSVDPPVPVAGPLGTGLPPYSVVALP